MPGLVSTTVGVTMIGAVDQRAGQAGQRAPLPADVGPAGPAGVGEQLVAGAGHRPGRALEQLGRERLELGDQDAQHVGAVAAQALGAEARLVAELVDDLLHPVHGRLRDAPSAR